MTLLGQFSKDPKWTGQIQAIRQLATTTEQPTYSAAKIPGKNMLYEADAKSNMEIIQTTHLFQSTNVTNSKI